MDRRERVKFKKFLAEVGGVRGRHTELVSVFVPAGYDLNKIIQHLGQEQGTASNIKDARTRKNVIDSLERMIRHLRLYKATPPNGLAVYAGNCSATENKIDIKVFSVEPPQPLNMRLYRCDQYFHVEQLQGMLESDEIYGMIVMDNRDAIVAILQGTATTVLKQMHSTVPGKVKVGGQCLAAADSVVQLADGGLVPIGSMHNPLVVKSFNFGLEGFEDSPVLDKWDSGSKEVVKVVTRTPRLEIDSSGDHTFFVWQKGAVCEKLCSDLVVGDHLLMPEKISIQGTRHALCTDYYRSYVLSEEGRALLKSLRLEKGLSQKKLSALVGKLQQDIYQYESGRQRPAIATLRKICSALDLDYFSFVASYTTPSASLRLPAVLDERLAQFLGYFTGDGSFDNARLEFCEQDEAVAVYYEKLAQSLFCANTSLRFRADKNYYEMRVMGKPLERFVRGEFPALKQALDTRTPSKVMTSVDSVVAAYIRGLFDAEGYCTDDELAIGMHNKLLIRELQMLLLRFGVISSFCIYDNKGNPYSDNERYTLRVTDKVSLMYFSQQIGFTLLAKRKKLGALILKRTKRSYVRQIFASGSSIRAVLESYGMRVGDFFKVSNFFNDGRMMSKGTFLHSVLAEVSDDDLRKELVKHLEYSLIPVKIKQIVRTGEKVPMADISVKRQNFIANGVLVHNSQQRFARLREIAAHEFYQRIAEVVNKEFLSLGTKLKGILIGGPGMTKEKFAHGSYLNNQLKEKLKPLQDTSYTDESGLKELLTKSRDILANDEITQEREIMHKFLKVLATDPTKAAYGRADIERALSFSAVDTLLLSETVTDADKYEELADKSGAKVMIISVETSEGVQLRDLGGFAAFLRFPIGE